MFNVDDIAKIRLYLKLDNMQIGEEDKYITYNSKQYHVTPSMTDDDERSFLLRLVDNDRITIEVIFEK